MEETAENDDRPDNLYCLDDYRTRRTRTKESEQEPEEEDSAGIYVTIVDDGAEISIPKELWDFMISNGYDPSRIEEFDKFLCDLEEG